ncbi:MAG: ABC transporter permease [Anaerolineae bacterium]
MRSIALVIRHELLSVLRKPSFWVTTFVLPALLMLFSFGAQAVGTQALEAPPSMLPAQADTPDEKPSPTAIGYVDQAGIIEGLPDDVSASTVRAYRDEAAARAALADGELSQYYLVPADFMETGSVSVVTADFVLLDDIKAAGIFQRILNYNLLDGDAWLTRLATQPILELEATALEIDLIPMGRDQHMARLLVGYGTLFIFFFVLTMSSSFMLRSVTKEKENRVVEVLLVSLRPPDLMVGKIIGLGLLALLQMMLWIAGSLLTLRRGSLLLTAFGDVLSEGVTLPQGFVVWAVVYFVLGYVLYSSLLGAIGALAPNARETGSFTFLALLPLMLPVWLYTSFFEAPHGTLAVMLSLIPLTAPTAMLPRLAGGGVPWWQPAIGALLLAITAYGFALLAARFFRAGNLLSGASLSWRRIWAELRRWNAGSEVEGR